MKKYYLFFVLFFTKYEIPASINPMNTYTSQKLLSRPHISSPSVVTPATQTITVQVEQPSTGITTLDTSSFSSLGVLIDRSGSYQITSSLDYKGPNAAIIISASNVTLDLNNQALSFAGLQEELPIHAIIIVPGAVNVTIKNGTISGFYGWGIYVQATADNLCQNITFDGLKIINCFNGILLSYTSDSLIKNCFVALHQAHNSITTGIKINNCSAVNCFNCTSQSNTNLSGNAIGFYIQDSQMVTLDHCVACGNTSPEQCCGFLIDCSLRVLLETVHSQHNNVLLENQSSYGIKFTQSNSCTVRNSLLEYNDYGIFDDQSQEQLPNIFIKNTASFNKKIDFARPQGSPISYATINSNYLQGALQVATFDNISIKT